jgi:cytochrome P450
LPKFTHFTIFMGALICLVSCSTLKSTESKSADSSGSTASRSVATEEPISFINPETKKGFWEEFTAPTHMPTKVDKVLKHQLQIFGKWVRANPVATFQDLRKYAPVLSLEALPAGKAYKSKGTIVLSRYQDVIEVLNQPTKFTVRNYQKKMERSVGPFMLAYDGSQYNIKEKPWMRSMMPTDDLPKVREIVRRLVNEAISQEQYIGEDINGKTYGRLEVVNQIARKVPIQLSGEYFGFPGPSLDKMYEWSRATQDDFFHNVKDDKVVREAAIKAGKEMHQYLKELIAQKLRENRAGKTGDDVLSRLIQSGTQEFVEPQSAEDDRVRTNIIGTLVGGVETTQAAIVQSLAQLFLRPQMLKAARAAAAANNVDLVAKYVWEALRFHPVNPFVVRFAEEEVTLKSGAKIPAGYHVLVATQSAMFDETEPGFENPNQFRLDRDQSKFFHLGYGHHRCLGDFVASIEVPEVVMALLKLPNLRPASGQAGQIDFRKRLQPHMLKADTSSTSFPESYSLEYDASPVPGSEVSIANPKYAYEDYLMNFDRGSYRRCLVGLPLSGKGPAPYILAKTIAKNIKKHKLNSLTGENRELLFCRLNEEFRSCMQTQAKAKKFNILQSSPAHEQGFFECASAGNLTQNETAFYKSVMLGQELDVSKLDSSQAQRNTGANYRFEDHMKFYDRFPYRECFMNPAGLSAFKDDRDMIMYARLNIDFRLCMGKPILLNRYSGGMLGADRDPTYEKCKNGVYNPQTFKYEGALSDTEKYFYETEILGRQVRFSGQN